MSDASKAVFLSYASQDAEAARRLCEALRTAGVEVWLDQDGGLVGGDAWDAKIRGQIASCALFMPVISMNTQARREGYFRLEWKLAAQRTHMIADGTPFLVPVLIDATRDAEALVPPEFKSVQWTRLPGGETNEVFCARVKALLTGEGMARAFQGVEEHEDPRWKARATSASPGSRRWLVPAIASVAALVALAIWQPWKTALPSSLADRKLETAKSSAAPASETRQLVARAAQKGSG